MNSFRLSTCLLVLVPLVAAGCRSQGMRADKVPGAVTEAEAALAEDDAEEALSLMRSAAKSTGITTELRDRVQMLLEKACQRRIEELSQGDPDPDALADMVELDLPRQIAVEAGIRAAELYVADDEGIDAWKVLKKLDAKFPLHYERQHAADIMCDVGLVAIEDGPGFLGFFTHRDEGQAILEYVILNAPWARRADEAYRALSRRYELDREWNLAITRAEQLVLNHPGSPLRVAAQAQVPHLRLLSIKSPEYDRTAITTARRELEEWLAMYAGHDLEPIVRVDLGDCLRRLSDNDMIISRFYERVDNAFGARRHARRAIEEARDAGDAEREAEAQAWLDALPPAPDTPIPAAAAGAAP